MGLAEWIINDTLVHLHILQMKEDYFFFADDAMGEENDEEETEAIVNQVLDELGLDLADKMAGVAIPSESMAGKDGQKDKTAVAAGDGDLDADADLQARLDDLRRE